jgi:hypothetical protein
MGMGDSGKKANFGSVTEARKVKIWFGKGGSTDVEKGRDADSVRSVYLLEFGP